MAYRRSTPGVFSMSMLDTVTCGLGGAIVLLLYMASNVQQGAKLLFEELTPSDRLDVAELAKSQEPGEALPIPRGILTLIFRTSGGTGYVLENAINIAVSGCNNADLPQGVLSSTAHAPNGLFQPSDTLVGALSVSLWVEPNAPLPDCVSITPPTPENGACQYSIIADGYATVGAPVACTGALEFWRDPSVRTFEIKDAR